MGCFGGKRRTFKSLDNNQHNKNNNSIKNNIINNIVRTLRSSWLKGLDNKDSNSNINNSIGRSNRSRIFIGGSRSLKRLDKDHCNNLIIGNSSSRGSPSGQDDQTQRNPVTLKGRSNVAGKEEGGPPNNLSPPKSKDTNSIYKLRNGSSKTRLHLAAEKREESTPNDVSKKNRKTKGASKTGSDVNVLVNDDNFGNDTLSQKLKDGLLSQNFKDTDFRDSRRTKGKEARAFKYDDLAEATDNFRSDYFLGEGGFGKVYKGHLKEINQVVAIKQLDHMGSQGIREFVMEVLTLSLADHPNLVKLLGFCVDGDKRLLVYEYMPLGSLEKYLHGLSPEQKPLDWITRMKIVAGAARGLEYLHEEIKPPVIYRDLKCANILLGEGYHPKLSDFGLAKVGPSGNKTHVSTRVMGTYGYCAPDYVMTGQLNFKSDIYSFGVVLLELITGRKAFDHAKSGKEQSLVAWARPLFKDRKKFTQMADPLLQGHYPIRALHQALVIAAMCIQEKPTMRPDISDIVNALTFLASQTDDPAANVVKGSSRITSYSSCEKDSECLYFSLGEKSNNDDDFGHKKTHGSANLTRKVHV